MRPGPAGGFRGKTADGCRNRESVAVELHMMWQVWRQDDNGNRFLVGSYPTRELAQARMDELSRSPHRQTYWISEKPGKATAGDGGAVFIRFIQWPAAIRAAGHCFVCNDPVFRHFSNLVPLRHQRPPLKMEEIGVNRLLTGRLCSRC